MRISKEEILKTLGEKGFSCENVDEYKNLDTILRLQCSKGHKTEANYRTIRDARFCCQECAGEDSSRLRDEIPVKIGHRLVAIDNATENMGVSVFDNGKLVYYNLYRFYGETIDRIVKNRHFLVNEIIKKWRPDFIMFEDI